jgi:hypothetical protein
MRKLTLLLFMLSMSTGSLMAQKDIYKFQYEISCKGLGEGGTKQIEIRTFCGKKGDLQTSAMRDCLHGLIFRGVKLGTEECPNRPIIPNSSESDPKHKDFFDRFLYSPSEHSRFFSRLSIAPRGVMKVKKGGYEGNYIVNVDYDALVDYLEQNDVIKKLGGKL